MVDSPIYNGIWETRDEAWDYGALQEHSADQLFHYFGDNGRNPGSRGMWAH